MKLNLTKTQVATGYKGPVVYAYHELRDLAAANHVRFLFEATVTLAPAIAAVASAGVGGAPIFSLFREALPAARLEPFRGILNSTTNLILTEMEHGNSFEAAVKKAQELGIAETDPSFDVDGWDATVKVSALATVLTLAPAIAAVASAGVDYPLKPYDITREGIRGLSMEQVLSALMMGRRYKLVCHAERSAKPTARWWAACGRSRCPATSRWPGATARRRHPHTHSGASVILFQMDVIHGLTRSKIHPNAVTTAYGPLEDFIAIARVELERM